MRILSGDAQTAHRHSKYAPVPSKASLFPEHRHLEPQGVFTLCYNVVQKNDGAFIYYYLFIYLYLNSER